MITGVFYSDVPDNGCVIDLNEVASILWLGGKQQCIVRFKGSDVVTYLEGCNEATWKLLRGKYLETRGIKP